MNAAGAGLRIKLTPKTLTPTLIQRATSLALHSGRLHDVAM